MAEGARLESVFRVKPNEGSNPSLSAKFEEPALRRFFCARNNILTICHVAITFSCTAFIATNVVRVHYFHNK